MRSVVAGTAGCVGVLILSACGVGSLRQNPLRHNQHTVSYVVSSPVHAVVVRGYVSGITVTGSDRDTISVTEQVNYASTPPVTTHQVVDGILTLTYSCADQLYCGVGYDVQVPAGLGQVTASTSAGSINGSGLAANRAEFSTQAGSISVAFTSAPAMVDATASAGAITIRVPDTASYAVTAQADVGALSVEVPRSASSPHAILAQTRIGSVAVKPA